MKKTLFSALLLLLFMRASGQKNQPVAPDMPTDEKTGLISYSTVVETEPTLSTQELMARAAKWYKKFYPSVSTVITKVDTVNNEIDGKAQFWTYKMLKGNQKTQNLMIRYPFVMKFKQGKWKIDITNIKVVASSDLPLEKLLNSADPNVETNYAALNDAKTYFENLLDSLKQAMAVPSTEKKSDDW